MKRLIPYLGIGAAFLVVVAATALSHTLLAGESASTPIASTSPAAALLAFPNKEVPSIASTTPALASTNVVPELPLATPVITNNDETPSPQTSFNQTEVESIATDVRSSLVNIICSADIDTKKRSISGSGVFIDSKGIILTNAHIAQYFLLKNHRSSCLIRTGSPAHSAYLAEPIFVSSAWIRANPSTLTEKEPSGTGEHDFAFLAITKSATETSLPSSFPFISLKTSPAKVTEAVLLGSYGAQLLSSREIASSLYPTLVFGEVREIFTFATTTIDVIALGGSAVAQEGSSGGAVVGVSGELAGIITTSTVTGELGSRNVNAITASYIETDYLAETGRGLNLLLEESVEQMVNDFSSKITELEGILTANFR